MIHRDTLWTYSHPTIFLMKAGDVLLTALGPQPAEKIDPPAGNSLRVGVCGAAMRILENRRLFIHLG